MTFLRVVSGHPTDEELAAVVVALASVTAEVEPSAARPAPTQWSARRRLLGDPVRPGPAAWRASALPR
jgi:hypothetical protein